MKEISARPLRDIQSVIPGENYANIKARLDQLLPDMSHLFAYFKVEDDEGIWYGQDQADYKPFKDASDIEKEGIAARLEICRETLCANPPEKMEGFVAKLFAIPSESQIFWYKNEDGGLEVTLAQWGFERRSDEQQEDIIQVLIEKERPLTQVPVTLKFIFSNMEPAANFEFKLHLFNNEKVCKTDANGEYHVGTLYAGKKIAVSTIDGTQSEEFFIEKGKEFITTLNLTVDYTLTVKNQFGEPKSDFLLIVDGDPARTNGEGVFNSVVVLEPDSAITVEIPEKESKEFKISSNPENNNFVIEVEDEKPALPPTFKVKLLDYDGKQLPSMPFKITDGNRVMAQGVTDENGYATVNAAEFKDKSKYQIVFEDSKEYRDAQKTKRNQSNG